MGNNKEKSDSGNFLVQGSILAAAGIIVRFIGLLYKIPMTRAIGDEGIGYYNTAYEIYNIGLILSSYSLPLAISKLIAARRVHGKNQDVQRVFKAGLLFGLVAGGLMTTDFAVWRRLDHGPYLQQPQQRPAVKGHGTAPFWCFPLWAWCAAISRVLATWCRPQFPRLLSRLSMPSSVWLPPSPSCTGSRTGKLRRLTVLQAVPLGTLSGALAAFVFLDSSYVFIPQTKCEGIASSPQADRLESWNHVYTALFLTLTPIILSQFVYQLSGSVDNSMFGFLMSGKGLTEKERLSLLGIYGGKYRLLSNVPVAVASSLGTSMIPSIVRSRAQKNRTDVMYKIRLTIKFNMLIAIPCAFGMAALASPVLRLIFRDSRDLTRNLLMLGAPAVIFFSLSTVTNAVLQGIDLMQKIRHPLRHLPGGSRGTGVCHVKVLKLGRVSVWSSAM